MAQDNKAQSEIRYLNPVSVDVKKKKYCRFKKLGIKYVDYKDGEFLKKFAGRETCPPPRDPALRNRLHEIIKRRTRPWK